MRRIELARTKSAQGREPFAQWLRDRLTELGYDLSTPRAGGQARFARDAGISHPVISRTLRGTNTPTPDVLEAMAPVLEVPHDELLVRAGILAEDELPRFARSSDEGPATSRELAAMAGIHDADLAAQFETFLAGLQVQQEKRDSQKSP